MQKFFNFGFYTLKEFVAQSNLVANKFENKILCKIKWS